jgi:catechol 2,3-dioxygenase-like lactoylglutathione lyase family enzyme
MLHHVSVGVRDVERAARFYDAVLGTLGYRRVMEFLPYAIAYGDRNPEFWVQLPSDQKPATVGNGVHIGFTAKSKEAIHAFHRAALVSGGANEGDAGPRPDYGPAYYGAFVRDLDGNKLEAVLAAEEPAAKKPASKDKKTKRKAKARAKSGTKRAKTKAKKRRRAKAK